MTTEKIITTIRKKFIENFDEGLLLDADDRFALSEIDEKHFRQFCGSELSSKITRHVKEREALIFPNKKDVFAYLTVLLLKTKLQKKTLVHGKYEPVETFYYPAFDDNFQSLFYEYWLNKTDTLNTILDNSEVYIDVEKITQKDLVYVNVGDRDSRYSVFNNNKHHFWVYNKETKYYFGKTADCKPIKGKYADIFIFTEKHFVKLSLGKDGLIDRTQHLFRDIKKINVADKNLIQIYFHGHYDPETIILDDYKSAVQLQNHLTDKRQKR